MQPCAYGEPFGLVLIAGSWRGKLTSLPLGLFQLISFFSGRLSPFQSGLAIMRGCLAVAIFRVCSVLE